MVSLEYAVLVLDNLEMILKVEKLSFWVDLFILVNLLSFVEDSYFKMKRLKIKIKKAYANENVKTTFLWRVKPSMEG
jgi:hypothetical protein